MTEETKLFAVSHGNGNDGVSHLYPDYYVHTDKPFVLAACAMISQFRDEFQKWAAEVVLVDGEADYTISATIMDPPPEPTVEPHRDEADDDTDEIEDVAEISSWSEANGAWRIVEVFADDGPNMSDPWHKPVFQTLEQAFDAATLALAIHDAPSA